MYNDLYQWFLEGKLYLKCLEDVCIDDETVFTAGQEYEVGDVYLSDEYTTEEKNISYLISSGQLGSDYVVPHCSDDFEILVKGVE
jgi:hypothetical protein